MARLCSPCNLDEEVTKTPDGKFKLNGFVTRSHILSLDFHSSLLNASQFVVKKGFKDCLKLLIENKTDYIIGFASDGDEKPFYVPVPYVSTSLHLISGYDVGKYIKDVKFKGPNSLGVLSNIYNFDFQVYFAILLFIISIGLLLLAHSLKIKAHLIRIGKKRLKLLKTYRRVYKKLSDVKRTKTKLVSLVSYISYFLLITPFLLLFKTNQVVNEKPFIISNYEEIINANASIYYPSIAVNETVFLIPTGFDVDHNNIMNKFWNFFQTKSQHYDFSNTQTFDKLFYLKDKLINGKGIFLTEFSTIVNIKAILCSFTKEDEYIQIFIYHDRHQRAEVQGMPVRRGYYNPQLNKKHRALFEMDLYNQLLIMGVEYIGFQYTGTSRDHRRIQYEYCQKEQPIELTTKDHIPPLKVEFYSLSLKILSALYLFALIIFVTEHLL